MFIIDYRTKQLIEHFLWLDENMLQFSNILSAIWLFLSQWHVTNAITVTVRHRLVLYLYWKYMLVMILRVILNICWTCRITRKPMHLQDLIPDELDNSDNITDYICEGYICTYNPVLFDKISHTFVPKFSIIYI